MFLVCQGSLISVCRWTQLPFCNVELSIQFSHEILVSDCSSENTSLGLKDLSKFQEAKCRARAEIVEWWPWALPKTVLNFFLVLTCLTILEGWFWRFKEGVGSSGPGWGWGWYSQLSLHPFLLPVLKAWHGVVWIYARGIPNADLNSPIEVVEAFPEVRERMSPSFEETPSSLYSHAGFSRDYTGPTELQPRASFRIGLPETNTFISG